MHDKAFNIAKNPKYDGYQWGRSLMIYNFFDKGTSSKTVKTENILNKELAEELYKPIIRKFEKRKYTHLSYAIFGVLVSLICN